MNFTSSEGGCEARNGGLMKSIGMGRAGVVVAAMAIAVFSLSCSSSELNDSAAPVHLVLSNVQELDTIDLSPAAVGCDVNIGQVTIRSILKDPNPNVDQRFNDLRIRRYRVSYRRTDGGTLIPQPFVQSIDLFVAADGTSDLGNFRIFQREAITQAPFAALLPTNGGRDPETGRKTVSMDVTLEVFGETIAGSNISGSTTFPLTFCYECGGCG
jgi:hypothetical protein